VLEKLLYPGREAVRAWSGESEHLLGACHCHVH